MVIAVTAFWCVSKREGYYLMIVGFFGTVINQFLKILCCVPRPWIKDPDFTNVESARAEATGYSFPSRHTQNAVATYGGIARYTRRGWLRVVLVVLTVLIAFSRMYLGVHTPLDVGVAAVIAVALVFALYPLMERSDSRHGVMGAVLAVMLAVGLRPVLWKLLLVVILQWCTSPLSGHMLAQFEYRVNQNLEQHLELPDGEQEAGQ